MRRTKFLIQEIPLRILGFKTGDVFCKLYVKIDGETMEVMRTTDCPRHIVTMDKTRHFCTGDDGHAYPLPEQKVYWMCSEVCQDKKKMLQKEIEEHGAYFDTKTIESIQKYIAGADTFKREEEK